MTSNVDMLPWDINPALTKERLIEVGKLIQETRDEVIDLHDENIGDTPKGTGLRAYECIRSKIIQASIDNPDFDYLQIVKDDGKFTFAINSVPVRFYRGSPSSPTERRLLPCVEALGQMELLSHEIGDYSRVVWFLCVQTDKARYFERLYAVGFLDSVQVCCYEVPIDGQVTSMTLIRDDLPKATVISKPQIALKSNNNIENESHEQYVSGKPED